MMIFGLLLELLLFVGVYLQKGDADDCNVIVSIKTFKDPLCPRNVFIF
jgi:hypothetical protein